MRPADPMDGPSGRPGFYYTGRGSCSSEFLTTWTPSGREADPYTSTDSASAEMTVYSDGWSVGAWTTGESLHHPVSSGGASSSLTMLLVLLRENGASGATALVNYQMRTSAGILGHYGPGGSASIAFGAVGGSAVGVGAQAPWQYSGEREISGSVEMEYGKPYELRMQGNAWRASYAASFFLSTLSNTGSFQLYRRDAGDDPGSVPEPGTWALCFLGITAVWAKSQFARRN